MRRILLVFLLAPLVACGEEFEDDSAATTGGDPIDLLAPVSLTPGNVRAFANASAPQIFTWGVAVYSGVGVSEDPCPKMTQDGNKKIFEGGCTTMDGQTVTGNAIAEETDTSIDIEYDTFGYAQVGDCHGAQVEQRYAFDGTFNGKQLAPGKGEFKADLVIDSHDADPASCVAVNETYLIDYAGTAEGMQNINGGIALEGRTTWDGSGRVGAESVGRADVSTSREVIDRAVCATEALSGTTMLQSAGDKAVITYDGASDCEPNSTVTYTINDAPQGELIGVSCAIDPREDNGWPWALLSALGLVRCPWRRASRRSRAPSSRAAGASPRIAPPPR